MQLFCAKCRQYLENHHLISFEFAKEINNAGTDSLTPVSVK